MTKKENAIMEKILERLDAIEKDLAFIKLQRGTPFVPYPRPVEQPWSPPAPWRPDVWMQQHRTCVAST